MDWNSAIEQKTFTLSPLAGCTVIQDKAGNKLTGLTLFQSSEMKIFMTNEITILFNQDHDVISCAPIVDISVDDKIDTEPSQRTSCSDVAFPKFKDTNKQVL